MRGGWGFWWRGLLGVRASRPSVIFSLHQLPLLVLTDGTHNVSSYTIFGMDPTPRELRPGRLLRHVLGQLHEGINSGIYCNSGIFCVMVSGISVPLAPPPEGSGDPSGLRANGSFTWASTRASSTSWSRASVISSTGQVKSVKTRVVGA